MAQDAMRAFDRTSDGNWKQTPETQKVLGIIRDSGGRDFKVEPMPSPMAQNGEGQWGLGGGVYMPSQGRTFVDPVNGTVSVAAHEAGHASFETDLIKDTNSGKLGAFEKLNNMQGASDGNKMRAVYETMSKPIMLEEANAQGVMQAAMDKAGYKADYSGWKSIPSYKTGLADDIPAALAYPGEYRMGGRYDRGMGEYIKAMPREDNQLTQEEMQVLGKTRDSLIPAMTRQFQKGYNLIK